METPPLIFEAEIYDNDLQVTMFLNGKVVGYGPITMTVKQWEDLRKVANMTVLLGSNFDRAIDLRARAMKEAEA
jgi:hypothetical protein